MSRGCQKHSGNLFCTSCRIRLCTVLAWQFPHLKGRLELYTNWTTALSAEQPHLLKVCWLVRSSANSLYPYQWLLDSCFQPLWVIKYECIPQMSSLSWYLFWLRNDVMILLLCLMSVANIPHAGLIHTISPFFLWELMDASYIGSMPTMQNQVICWFPARKWEPVAGDMVNPFHPKEGATHRSVWQPMFVVKSKLVLFHVVKPSFCWIQNRISAGWIMLNLNFFACWIVCYSWTPRFFRVISEDESLYPGTLKSLLDIAI